jgi:hypothetical protein
MARKDNFKRMTSCSISVEREQAGQIRFDKVLNARRKLRSGEYDLEEHLDVVVDKLLEKILIENQKNDADSVRLKNAKG